MTTQDERQPPAQAAPEDDSRISIDEFMKVELRVAKVLEAEAVPKSKKLLKLKVDTGRRPAHDRRGHRRGLSARAARRPHDRHRREPAAGEADGRSSRTGWSWPPAPTAACRCWSRFDQDVPPGARVR